jgi:iron(III) transport system permease protein
LLTLGEFTVPGYLRYSVYPVESFTRFSASYDFAAGTAAAMPLLIVALILLWLESRYLRNRDDRLQISTTFERSATIALGQRKGWLLALLLLIGALLVFTPLAALLVEASGISIYAEALERTGDALLRSLLYALIGASILTLMGFFLGYTIHHRSLKAWWLIDRVSVFLFALPGTVVGIGLIGLWNHPATNVIYTTSLIILLGYLAKYMVLGSRINASQLARIAPSMEEAAQAVGAGWFRRIVFIVLPLARNGLLAAWLVGYIVMMRDTTITMLVYPAGLDTMPVRIFTLMANGSSQLIAALCIVMIAATLMPLALAWLYYVSKTGKGKEWQ